MAHEEAKKGKIKTRLLDSIREEGRSTNQQINLEVELRKKTMIPENEIQETIKEIHRLLCHAGVEKIADYMKDRYIGKNL